MPRVARYNPIWALAAYFSARFDVALPNACEPNREGTCCSANSALILTFGSFEKFLKLLRTHAFLGVRTPLDAGCADWAGVQMSALLALGLGLVTPNLDLLAALLASDVLRLRLTDLYASRATFLKHDYTIPLFVKNRYDANHTNDEHGVLSQCNAQCPMSSASCSSFLYSFITSAISIL